MKNQRKVKGKVSIIIPVYNCEKYIENCIESVLKQSYQNLEIIICDDCSTDNSYKIALNIASRDPRIILLRNDINKKSGMTRNRCIQEASGEYIFVLDADDYVDERIIEKEVKILNEEKEISFVSVGMYRFNEEGIWGRHISTNEYPNKKSFLWGLPFVHAGTMFRTDVLIKIDGYRIGSDTTRTEDFDLMLRLYINGYYGKNILEPLYFYNEDISAYMRRKYRYRIDEAKIRFKAYSQLDLMPVGIIYALKPLIVGLIPRKLQYKMKKRGL